MASLGDNEVTIRLEQLRHPWRTTEELQNCYGLTNFKESRVRGGFIEWAKGKPSQIQKNVSRSGLINRNYFEVFLQNSKIVPNKLAATRLGMKEPSFIQITKRMSKSFLSSGYICTDEGWVREEFIRNIRDFIPNKMNYIFMNHSEMCKCLHKEIREFLGIDVVAAFCVTSQILDPENTDYAYEIDAINGDPVGLRYQAWLNTGKPMSLRPDVCSSKLFYKNKDVLEANIVSMMGVSLTEGQINKLVLSEL